MGDKAIGRTGSVVRWVAGQQQRLDLGFGIRSMVAAPRMGRVIGGFFGIALGQEQAHQIQGLVLMWSRMPATLHDKEFAGGSATAAAAGGGSSGSSSSRSSRTTTTIGRLAIVNIHDIIIFFWKVVPSGLTIFTTE